MKYHTIKSNLWQDEKVALLSCEAKLLFIYLFSNEKCSMSGLYKISPDFMSFETKLPNVNGYLQELASENLIRYDFKKNSVWVIGKLKHHKNTFHSYGVVKSICNDLEEFRYCSFFDSIMTQYPELLDLSITLERLKKQRYKDKALTSDVSDIVSDSVSVIVSPLSKGYREGIEGVSL